MRKKTVFVIYQRYLQGTEGSTYHVHGSAALLYIICVQYYSYTLKNPKVYGRKQQRELKYGNQHLTEIMLKQIYNPRRPEKQKLAQSRLESIGKCLIFRK